MDAIPSLMALFSVEWMISIRLFNVEANVGNLPLSSGITAVQSQPNSHTFTVILAVYAPSQNGVINCGKVYYKLNSAQN